jgi:polysaccharide pyruvyl transferase WcaK-like protein
MNVETYEQYEELAGQAQPDVCYLTGSDQIWNPDRCYKHFFLEFVRSGKCISYAASMGKTDIPTENQDKFRLLMQRLDRISVRETQCRDVLQPLTEKKIEVHIDPTLLMGREEWRQYEKPYPVRGPYILVYMIYWNPSCKEQLKELKRRTGLPVYAVCSGLSRVYADKKLFDVGVEEFLWLIDHAEYVVTSSFHGVAMSTVFEKKFAAVVNPDSPSRIQHLMQTLGIPEVSISELDSAEDFDYYAINDKILQERVRAIQYLKEAISE